MPMVPGYVPIRLVGGVPDIGVVPGPGRQRRPGARPRSTGTPGTPCGPGDDEQVPGGRVGGVLARHGQAVGVGEVGAAQAELAGQRVHLGHEPGQPGPVGAGQHVGGVTAGRHQHGLQQLLDGELVPDVQARAAAVVFAGVVDGRLGDGEAAAQIARPEHYKRGHDLGQAADRALGVGAAAPQQAAAGLVLQGRPERVHVGGSSGAGADRGGRGGRGGGGLTRGEPAGQDPHGDGGQCETAGQAHAALRRSGG